MVRRNCAKVFVVVVYRCERGRVACRVNGKRGVMGQEEGRLPRDNGRSIYIYVAPGQASSARDGGFGESTRAGPDLVLGFFWAYPRLQRIRDVR